MTVKTPNIESQKKTFYVCIFSFISPSATDMSALKRPNDDTRQARKSARKDTARHENRMTY